MTGLVPIAKCGMSWDPETSSVGKGTSHELYTQDPHLLPVLTLPAKAEHGLSTDMCYIVLSRAHVRICSFEAFEAFTCAIQQSTFTPQLKSILTSQEASEGSRGSVCCRGSHFLDFEFI